ncbi:hypothetical protein RHMOL_Rhmol11G0154900 [Rhododendron molle]|uniref:Uncharacterized protein n=1 Tax=Rhododendron molle TaxID=49168 RepID=A0ACC0LTM9_RHOML|nr:hypothetical protein RHMOL_Rhmol11G0154900 [Rhododendron molle]
MHPIPRCNSPQFPDSDSESIDSESAIQAVDYPHNLSTELNRCIQSHAVTRHNFQTRQRVDRLGVGNPSCRLLSQSVDRAESKEFESVLELLFEEFESVVEISVSISVINHNKLKAQRL